MNLKNRTLIKIKGFLFFFLGILSASLLLTRTLSVYSAVLLLVAIWSFCRFYYFAFYVLHNYVDPMFNYSSLSSLVAYFLKKKQAAAPPVENPTLLVIDCSPRVKASISRVLTNDFAEAWKSKHPGRPVIHRDLGTQSLPYVTEAWIEATSSSAPLTPEQKAEVAVSDELIRELKTADHYVIAIPMYNFTVPANFKAYIDQIARAGETVTFSATGVEGQLKNKRVTIIISCGDRYTDDSIMAPCNFVQSYLRTILGFLGLTDIRFFFADRVGEVTFGQRTRENYLNEIREKARELEIP